MDSKWQLGFVIFLIAFIRLAVTARPSINVPEEWVFEIEVIDDQPIKPLVITCWGNEPLTWHTLADPQYYKITKNVTESGTHFSSLTIDNPFTEDTGYFNCSMENGGTASTYVYVYEEGKAFVDSTQHKQIDVEIGKSFELDCRTTRPDIKVTVYKDSTQDVTNLFEKDSFNRFRKKAESLQETGIYHCRENKFSSKITWLVNVKPPPTIQRPSIEMHRNTYHVVGVEFSMNCTIPMDPNDNPVVKWKLPNPHGVHHEMVMSSDHDSGNTFKINILKMVKPTLEDTGNYTCVVRQGDLTIETSTYITVEESREPFITFDKKITSHKLLFVKEGERFQWVLYFTAFPNNLTYHFEDPYKRKLSKYMPRISMDYVYDEGKLSLEISNTTAKDFGKYTAKMIAPNGKFDVTSVVLVVNATPKVEFVNVPQLFPAEENITLTTHILSFTLEMHRPKVTWYLYDHCPYGIGSCEESKKKLLTHQLHNETNKPANHYESYVTIPSKSGYVWCEAENPFGKTNSSTTVIVSDKKNAFMMSVSTESGITDIISNDKSDIRTIRVIEDDDVSIECSALDFLYKNLSFITKLSTEPFNCNTSLSSGKCLHLRSVSMQHNENYKCQVTDRISENDEFIRLSIFVLEKKAPTLLPGSNVSEEGVMISVRASDPFSIACLVDGQPMPNVTWLKDDINIEEIDNFVDDERVFLRDRGQVLEFKFAQKEYEGIYTCMPENRVGVIYPYASLVVQGAGLTSLQWGSIGLVIVFILCLCIIVLVLIVRIRKESKLRNELRLNQLYLFEKGNVGDLNKECTIDEQADLLPYDKAFEVERENIKLGKQLGAGAFGRVMQAEVEGLDASGKPTRVAVKMCKDGSDMGHLRALTLELKIMVHLGKHLNIVNLIGAHTGNMDKGDLLILVEYCKYGNLLKHIQKYRSRFINQIDPHTGVIDLQRITSLPGDTMGRFSRCSGRSPSVDADGYLETRSRTGSMRDPSLLPRKASSASNTGGSFSGTSRPGLYVGNPHYTTVAFAPSPTLQGEGPPSPAYPPVCVGGTSSMEHYVTATQLPPHTAPSVVGSTGSNPSSDGPYHETMHTEMTGISSPPPFSPSSTVSESAFFDGSGNPLDSGGIPGVSSPFTTSQLICWAWQVANGMDYLSRRKILHGDLAARNLLLAEHNVVKISDFGLSRDIYKTDIYMKQGDEIMPIKWMAPEAIQQKLFSIQSDVWAFGITLWEMFTLGNTPYPGIPLNQNFPVALENGMRMEKPKYSNDDVYDLMMHCWRLDPLERPNFVSISDTLASMLSPERTENYVAMNTEYMRKNEEWMEFKEDYLNMVTSPDIRNLSAPLVEAEAEVDESYIPMRVIGSEGEEPIAENGYLDMRSVISSPPPLDAIFSPRPPSPLETQTQSVFKFNGEKIALSEEQQSPAETTNLLEKDDVEGLIKTTTPNEFSENINNNNINKLNTLNQQEPTQYQNLGVVLPTIKQNSVESSVKDDQINDDDTTKKNYISIPKPECNYINTSDLV